MEITIVTTQSERDEMRRVLDGYYKVISGEIPKEEFIREYPMKVWIDTEDLENDKHPSFTVVDNSCGECFEEDFCTLDGAVLYAAGVYYTCEHQDDWDYEGAVKDGGDIKKRMEVAHGDKEERL